jgi:lipoprotein-releasing system permease protein
LNFELFIAKRLITTKQYKSSISSPIIKIAIVAIALGMIVMMISIATGIGLQQKISDKITVFNGHVQITNFDDNQSDITITPVKLTDLQFADLKKMKGINQIQVYATKAGIIRTEKDFEGIVLKGVDKNYEWSNLKEYLIEGKVPKINDDFSFEVLISKTIADRLGLKVNDEFNTFFLKENPESSPNVRVFRVVGIYNSGFNEFDSGIILGDIKQIQRLNKWDYTEVGGYEILLDDFNQIKQKGEEIYYQIGAKLNSKTIIEKYPALFEWIQLFDINIVVIIVIMILVAGINMITALLVLILEKTQLIGILKSMGANNISIQKVFMYNASFLILLGLFWGNLIGLSLLFAQKYFGVITLNPETYYVSVAPVYIGLDYILMLNIGTLILCLAMLLIPSLIISKISPVKAIKFE